MKSGKVLRVFVITLVLILSTGATVYKLMQPKPSDIDFDFVSSHPPNEITLGGTSDPTYVGSIYAHYYWKGSFAKAKAEVTAELLKKGWHTEKRMPSEGLDVAAFYNSKGAWVIMMNSGSPDGKPTSDPQYRLANPNTVTMDILQPLPPGFWSKLRVLVFARKE